MSALSRGFETDRDVYRPLKKECTLRELAQRKLHHGRSRFINPWHIPGSRSLFDVITWKLFSRNHFKQFYKDEPLSPVTINWKPVHEHPGLSVTFVTHATLLIKDSGTSILIDPVLSGLFWPYQDFTPLRFDVSDMPSPDYVLITHGHYDHLDADSLEHFKDTSRFVAPLGYRDILAESGIHNLKELDWFDSVADGSREIVLLPSNHWTMRNPAIGPNTGLWGSYLIKTSSGPVIYVSGDTGLFDRFDEIGREYDIDLAVFNLGAYEPRWFMKHSHMNPAETVRAFKDLRAKKLMVVHWGTFRLGDDPVHFPPEEIRKEMEKSGLSDRLVDIRHGQTLYFDGKVNPH